MSDYSNDLRYIMDIIANTTVDEYEPIESTEYDLEVEISSDDDSIIESLEMLRFKLLNYRQTEGSPEYALGFETAYTRVAEMIDNIIRSQQ